MWTLIGIACLCVALIVYALCWAASDAGRGMDADEGAVAHRSFGAATDSRRARR